MKKGVQIGGGALTNLNAIHKSAARTPGCKRSIPAQSRTRGEPVMKNKLVALVAAVGAASLMAACSVPRPKPVAGAPRCDLPRTILTAIETGDRSSAIASNPLSGVLGKMAAERAVQLQLFQTNLQRNEKRGVGVLSNDQVDLARIVEAMEIRHLVLSGGGQHGSFGTGFLAGMDPYPDYDIVTGVSTGALQAPLAILGKKAPPADRLLTAADDFPPLPGDRTNLGDLVAGYTISRQDTLYRDYGKTGVIRGARMGDLEPLRTRIDKIMTPQTLRELAELEPGKELFVLLLNWDTGHAEAVDMLALSRRFANGDAHARSCFMDVLIAASSEPIGTPPVPIDDHLYVDAGLRFGVFARDAISIGNVVAAGLRPTVQALQHDMDPQKSENASPPPLVFTDMIRNGDMDVREWRPEKYDALDVINRARSILVNQVYAFSMDEVLEQAGEDHIVRFAYIRSEEMNAGAPAQGATFDPVYMKRMIAVGKARGAANDWGGPFGGKPSK